MQKINLTPALKNLMLHLVETLQEQQNRAGCNDFNLKKHMPQVADRRALMKTFHDINGDIHNFDPTDTYTDTLDVIPTHVFYEWLKEQPTG